MSRDIIREKDKIQARLDAVMEMLSFVDEMNGINFKAARRSGDLWDFGKLEKRYKNGRVRHIITDVKRGLSMTLLAEEIIKCQN